MFFNYPKLNYKPIQWVHLYARHFLGIIKEWHMSASTVLCFLPNCHFSLYLFKFLFPALSSPTLTKQLHILLCKYNRNHQVSTSSSLQICLYNFIFLTPLWRLFHSLEPQTVILFPLSLLYEMYRQNIIKNFSRFIYLF